LLFFIIIPTFTVAYTAGEIVSVPQTLTIEERERVAKEFYERFGYLEADKVYCAWSFFLFFLIDLILRPILLPGG
jgi:hypothetical protein